MACVEWGTHFKYGIDGVIRPVPESEEKKAEESSYLEGRPDLEAQAMGLTLSDIELVKWVRRE